MKITGVILTEQERLDVLTTAIESRGIQYWACEYGKITIDRDDDSNITKAEFDADNQKGERQHYIVIAQTIQVGVDRVIDPAFQVRDDILYARILADDNDSESCDVIIQAALFGELVYG